MLRVGDVRLFSDEFGVYRYDREDRGYRGIMSPSRPYFADLGDEGVCVSLDWLLEHPKTLRELSGMDVVFLWVYEDFLDFEAPTSRMDAKTRYEKIVRPTARSAAEIVDQIGARVLVMSQHGNFDESLRPYLADYLDGVCQLLARPNVVGWIETMPRHVQFMRRILGKVVYLPLPHWPFSGEVVPLDLRSLRYRPPFRIYVARPLGGEGYDDNGPLMHVVAKEIGNAVGGAQVVYSERRHDGLDDRMKALLGLRAHASRGWSSERDVATRVRELGASHLYIHLGWRGGRTAVTSEAAALGVPAIVSRHLPHRVLYPRTCVDPYEVEKAVRLGVRILVDEQFRRDVVCIARRRALRFCHPDGVRQLLSRILARSS